MPVDNEGREPNDPNYKKPESKEEESKEEVAKSDSKEPETKDEEKKPESKSETSDESPKKDKMDYESMYNELKAKMDGMKSQELYKKNGINSDHHEFLNGMLKDSEDKGATLSKLKEIFGGSDEAKVTDSLNLKDQSKDKPKDEKTSGRGGFII